MKKIEELEPIIRTTFRVLTVALLLLCWTELRTLPRDISRFSHNFDALEKDVDLIQRDLAKIKDKIDPPPFIPPLQFNPLPPR